MSEQPVWECLSAAKISLRFAEAETDVLDRLTNRLTDPRTTARRKDDVWRTYLHWLVHARQVAVSIDKAGRAAGRPPQFVDWWDGLKADPTHSFFRAERNAALKDVAEVIVARPITDGFGRALAFWAFPHGPHAGDPLVARCQQYNDRLSAPGENWAICAG